MTVSMDLMIFYDQYIDPLSKIDTEDTQGYISQVFRSTAINQVLKNYCSSFGGKKVGLKHLMTITSVEIME